MFKTVGIRCDFYIEPQLNEECFINVNEAHQRIIQWGLTKRNKTEDDFDVANGVNDGVASLSCWGFENVMFQSTITFSMQKLGLNLSQTSNAKNIHYIELMAVNTS